MNKTKVKIKRWYWKMRLRLKWRKVPVREFPLMYTGPDLRSIRGLPGLAKGTPVAPVSGVKGARGAARIVDPIGIERVVHKHYLANR